MHKNSYFRAAENHEVKTIADLIESEVASRINDVRFEGVVFMDVSSGFVEAELRSIYGSLNDFSKSKTVRINYAVFGLAHQQLRTVPRFSATSVQDAVDALVKTWQQDPAGAARWHRKMQADLARNSS
jgi:hypothetical protein